MQVFQQHKSSSKTKFCIHSPIQTATKTNLKKEKKKQKTKNKTEQRFYTTVVLKIF